ncbi:hypothetical protein [Haloplasma contractile]|uniref:Uncharacterized protein n=1 Tax=Haloplasma contractile SSD-17B TaxID=1033810 RepID=F7PUC1_9MOLU|nr:hypothetical protein [Haloplasma contractile]ERJ11691.1 hypothetical protein HLPCO_002174 [Haloplasma contractile SSD-17B]
MSKKKKQKNKKLYNQEIKIRDDLYIRLDPDDHEQLLLYNREHLLGDFSLKRKTYTLFRMLQLLTDEEETIKIKDTDILLYAKEIQLDDNLFMKVSDEYFCPVVKFYQKNDGKEKLLYMIAMNHITKKFFNKLLVPFNLVKDQNLIYKNPSEFIEMLCIINYNKKYVS